METPGPTPADDGTRRPSSAGGPRLNVLTLALIVAGMMSAFSGWTLGFMHGYLESAESFVMAAELRPTTVSVPSGWLEEFDDLDRRAKAARPDLTEQERQWIVLLMLRAAHRHGVDPRLVMSVALAESNLRQEAVSPKGAVGIMQVMPSTARAFGANPHDLKQNIDVGVRYLATLLRRYGGDVRLALAAYNAGPSRVRDAVPPIPQTLEYVRRVVQSYEAR